MTDTTQAAAAQTPQNILERRTSFSFRRSLMAGLFNGLLIALILVFFDHVGKTPAEKLGYGLATIIGFAMAWLIFKLVLSVLPNGGACVQFILGCGAIPFLLAWDTGWVKWLVVPLVFAILIAAFLDYTIVIAKLEKHWGQQTTGTPTTRARQH
jgi:hypothetical protein